MKLDSASIGRREAVANREERRVHRRTLSATCANPHSDARRAGSVGIERRGSQRGLVVRSGHGRRRASEGLDDERQPRACSLRPEHETLSFGKSILSAVFEDEHVTHEGAEFARHAARYTRVNGYRLFASALIGSLQLQLFRAFEPTTDRSHGELSPTAAERLSARLDAASTRRASAAGPIVYLPRISVRCESRAARSGLRADSRYSSQACSSTASYSEPGVSERRFTDREGNGTSHLT
jgi:hypothetical protein